MPTKKATTTKKKAAVTKPTAKKPSARKKTTAKKTIRKKTSAKKPTARKKTTAKKTTAKAPARQQRPPTRRPSKRAQTTNAELGRRARPGDLIVIDSPKVGSPPREGEVLEVIQGAVSVSYRVLWADGHQTLISPLSGSARFVAASNKR